MLLPKEGGTNTRLTEAGVVRLELPHMNVVLSISAERGSRGGRTPQATDILDAVAAAGLATDPIASRLLRDLCPVDRTGDRDGIYADALRLALIARWLGLTAPAGAEQDTGPSQNVLPKWRLKRVTAYVDRHIGQSITLADLAAAAGLSRMYFAAQFRAATGLRPHEYVLRRRIDHAKAALVQTMSPLVDVALGVGFQTQAHFTTVFKRFVGETPKRWRTRQHELTPAVSHGE